MMLRQVKAMESGKNSIVYPAKLLALQGDRRNSPALLKERPIRVGNLKDAKKLLARLLVAFQRGEIDGRDAKDLAYLLSVFIQLAKDVELEERVKQLEHKMLQPGVL
jgi:hypothetical protein